MMRQRPCNFFISELRLALFFLLICVVLGGQSITLAAQVRALLEPRKRAPGAATLTPAPSVDSGISSSNGADSGKKTPEMPDDKKTGTYTHELFLRAFGCNLPNTSFISNSYEHVADPAPSSAATEPSKAKTPEPKSDEDTSTLNQPPSSALSAMISSTVQPMADQIQQGGEEAVQEIVTGLRSMSPEGNDGLRQRINAAPSPDENGKIKLTLKYNQVGKRLGPIGIVTAQITNRLSK